MDWGILAGLKNHFQKRFDKIKFFNYINDIKLFCYQQTSISRFIHPTASGKGMATY
jgi:hypothetical protein